ncbi:MAG: hypothetical protein ABSD68_03615 [Candidatus Micrarchaeales archaeon]|jgi:hypothetical protein
MDDEKQMQKEMSKQQLFKEFKIMQRVEELKVKGYGYRDMGIFPSPDDESRMIGLWTSPLTGIINECLGDESRLLEKVRERSERYPDFYHNGCIFDSNGVEIWWGDINLSDRKDRDALRNASARASTTFYVTREHYRADFCGTN